MNSRFVDLQERIGCKNKWLAEMLDMSEEHVSRLRSGKVQMTKVMELVMMALASGWRP